MCEFFKKDQGWRRELQDGIRNMTSEYNCIIMYQTTSVKGVDEGGWKVVGQGTLEMSGVCKTKNISTPLVDKVVPHGVQVNNSEITIHV